MSGPYYGAKTPLEEKIYYFRTIILNQKVCFISKSKAFLLQPHPISVITLSSQINFHTPLLMLIGRINTLFSLIQCKTSSTLLSSTLCFAESPLKPYFHSIKPFSSMPPTKTHIHTIHPKQRTNKIVSLITDNLHAVRYFYTEMFVLSPQFFIQFLDG